MILIKDGRVIDPKSGTDESLDILIENNKIVGIGKFQKTEDCTHVIDARGKIVAPGLVDVHVHFRDPGFIYKEDLMSGAQAAAAGGFTTVVCMANTNPIIDNVETLRDLRMRSQNLPVNVLNAAAVTKSLNGGVINNLAGLKEAGAIGFTDDGIPIDSVTVMMDAMEEAKKLDVPLSLHEEDSQLIGSYGVNQGSVSKKLGLKGAPALAEEVLVARDGLLALRTGAKINFQHVSSKVSVQLIQLLKNLGANIYAEVTPHHFSLNENAVLEKGTLAKVNPPLRTEEDRYSLIEGLKNDIIDIISTDHAPHSKEEKDAGMENAPSGMIGLETALALGITNLVRKGHLTMIHLLEKMTINPAELYQLDCGSLEVGKNADIVIFDEREKWTVGEFYSKSSNSPFIGETLYGRVICTICNGKIVYEKERGVINES